MLLLTFGVQAAPNLEEKIAQLQAQLDSLKGLQQEVNELKAQLAAQQQQALVVASPPLASTPPVVAKTAPTSAPSPVEAPPTSIGGYGEILYSARGGDADNPSQTDLARFVLFFGHRFSDEISFNSELEIEHAIASSDDEGEIEIEQAWLDYHFNDAANVKAGLFLIPLGFLNENHEPPVFYGVFRNAVETRIIPTTWREGGIGIHGRFGNGFAYDTGVTTGFDAGKIDEPAFGIKSGHQELQLANSNDFSVYGSVKYIGYPGLLLGAGIFSGNTGQDGASSPELKGVDARFTVAEVHARYALHGFDLQAMYARSQLGDADKVTAAIQQAAPQRMEGWFLQAAYHLWRRGAMELAPFARYEEYNITQKQDFANGLLRDPLARDRIETLGLSFKPVPEVVLKADYQNYERNNDESSFNLGLGYMF